MDLALFTRYLRLTSEQTAIIRLLVLQLVGLTLIGVVTVLTHFGPHHADVSLYYESSLKLMQGQVPYRDFRFEYPPLALLPMLLPRLMKLGLPLTWTEYRLLFLIENVLLSLLTSLLYLKIVPRLQSEKCSIRALKFYLLLVSLSSPLVLWRYDMFPALLTQLALLSVLIGRPMLAGTWLGFGVAAKLYPVVLIPIVGAYYLASRKYTELVRLLVGSLGAIALVFLPLVPLVRGELFSFLSYHQMRGLQIESLPAAAIILAHRVGLTKVEMEMVLNYGAMHLVSPLADSVLKWLPLVFILASAAVIAICTLRFRSEYHKGAVSGQSLVAYLVVALLTFMVSSKVFSPQYIIWLLPFAPLLRPRLVGILAIIFSLTIFIFPFKYDYILNMQIPGLLVLNLRNILVVVLLFWLLAAHLPKFFRIPIKSQQTSP